MGLVADALQDVCGGRGRLQDDGVLSPGQKDPLFLLPFCLGKRDDVDPRETQLPQSVHRGAQLADPAVNEDQIRSEEHTSELQSRLHLVCRLLLEKKKKKSQTVVT